MRFSLLMGPRQRPDLNQSAAEAWKNYIGDGIRAEEIGLDSVFIGEHHFSFAAGTGAPLVMATAIAARTERIRVGTAVLCLPFHNPLRLAEEVAAVSIVSGGRFDLGVGVGSQHEEFETFGIPSEERTARTWEALDVIEKCFSGVEQFSHEGKFFKFPNVRFILNPEQPIPIFWGGFGPQGARKAAQRGYHLFAPDVTGQYVATLIEIGRNPKDHCIGFGPMISIAGTKQQALDAVTDGMLFHSNVYALRRNLDGSWPPESARVSAEDLRKANDGDGRVGLFSLLADTVDGVIERLLPVVRGEFGPCTHLPIEFRAPGTKTADVEQSMRLFGREVLPVLRKAAAEAGN